jgi:hypothetical protein
MSHATPPQPRARRVAAAWAWALAAALVAILTSACRESTRSEAVIDVPSWVLDVPGRPDVAITLPVHLDRDQLTTSTGARATRYVLRAKTPVPTEMRGRELTFAIAHLAARAALKVNGRKVAPHDVPSEGSYRALGPQSFHLLQDATDVDSLDFELTLDHTWTQSAWLDTVPRLSATLDGDARFRAVASLNRAGGAAGLAATALLTLSYGALFLADRRRRAHGWQCLQSAAATFYPAFMLGITQVVFGTMEIPFVTVALVVTSVANTIYTHAQFGLKPPPRVWLFAVPIVMVAAVIFRGPFTSTRYLVPLALVAVVAASTSQIVIFICALRHRPVPINLVISTVGFPLATALGWADMSSWLGLGEPWGGAHLATFGMALVAGLQAAALTREHAQSLNRTDALNVELRGRVDALVASNREVKTLNDELRRQIAARSQDLARSLAHPREAENPPVLPAKGDVVEGRYQIVRDIGAGGMGIVYEVQRVTDGRRLALKVLHASGRGGGGAALARLAREAEIACHVDHPNIVGIVDVGMSNAGFLFVVMEYAAGPSLAELRDRFGDVEWALAILGQIAEGLTALHARGIIHRDLKPSNVLVVEAGADGPTSGERAKIADFGISTLTTDDTSLEGLADTVDAESSAPGRSLSLTSSGAILGTPLYMAPETMLGARHAKAPADVFSFGVIAFELLLGRLPYAEAAVLARLRGRSAPPATSLATACPSLDAEIADVLDRCLSADASQRPTAADLLHAIKTA